MSAREDARRAWRERVNAAAREFGEECRLFRDKPSGRCKRWSSILRSAYQASGDSGPCDGDPLGRLDIALSAPKPWRSARKPDPRRRYSRAHRRACWRCRVAHLWMHPSILRLVRDLRAYPEWDAGSEWSYVARFERLTRDPHGRRS